MEAEVEVEVKPEVEAEVEEGAEAEGDTCGGSSSVADIGGRQWQLRMWTLLHRDNNSNGKAENFSKFFISWIHPPPA